MKTIAFLGGGRITGALLAGLRLAKYKGPLIVHDHHLEKLRKLRKEYAAEVEPDLQRAIQQADILIIAVRPSSVGQLLDGVGELDRPRIAVSLAAGIPLSKLRAGLGPEVRWVRAMPSPACRSRRGLTALTFDRRFPATGKREIKTFFSHVGPVLEISEAKFDAFTVTYSSSHGYHALAALAEAGQRVGLDRKTALIAASHALADGIISWREGNISLEGLLHEAATPGGIAAAVMEASDRAGYRKSVQRGLTAGLARARKNSASF